MSWVDWLGNRAQTHPDRVAVVDATSGRQHSFRSFDNRANQIAHFCESWVGLVSGDCIGLLSEPSDDVLQIVVAADKLGLTALLLDPRAPSEALTAAINKHGPRTIFHGLVQAGLVQEIWFEVGSVEHIIPLRGAVDTANFEDIVAHYPPTPPAGEPRGDVPWLHFAAQEITWSDIAAMTADHVPDGKEEEIVAAPLHHPDGLGAALGALNSGQCVAVEVDSIRIIESPGEISSTQEHGTASQRNVPTGRSWLPHQFL